MEGGQSLNYVGLQSVGILVLVHQYVFVLGGEVQTHVSVFLQESAEIDEQVIEIHHLVLPLVRFVLLPEH